VTILAHFDGTAFVPDAPVDLPVGTPAAVDVLPLADGDAPATAPPSDSAEPRFASFLDFVGHDPDSPGDRAAQHDHYLYGTPKR
jgi:hypothetical protein